MSSRTCAYYRYTREKKTNELCVMLKLPVESNAITDARVLFVNLNTKQNTTGLGLSTYSSHVQNVFAFQADQTCWQWLPEWSDACQNAGPNRIRICLEPASALLRNWGMLHSNCSLRIITIDLFANHYQCIYNELNRSYRSKISTK